MKRRAVMFSGRLDRMFDSSKTWTSSDTKRILRNHILIHAATPATQGNFREEK